MGPLPQTPTDIIVLLTLMPYLAGHSTMCGTCIFADDTVGEVFHGINQSLNGPLAMEDMVLSTRCTKAQPIRKEGHQTLIGYQMKWSIVQEYPVSNNLITVSVYSQHIAIPHRGCIYGQMIRIHVMVPRHSDTSLMGILEKRISTHFTDYCTEPEEGLGMHAVTKDLRVEQEC
jgi:hypothetical protein